MTKLIELYRKVSIDEDELAGLGPNQDYIELKVSKFEDDEEN